MRIGFNGVGGRASPGMKDGLAAASGIDRKGQGMDSRIDRSRIGDLLEIQRLKGLYFYTLDHKDWQGLSALFAADASMIVDRRDGEGTPFQDVVSGRDALIAYIETRVNTHRTVHHGHTPLIEFDSDDSARGIWAMSDIVDYGDKCVLSGYGHYRETYRREGGIWKLVTVHLTRLRVDMLPPTRSWTLT
jgi:hypothetical protein